MSMGGQDYLRDPTVDAALEVLRRPRIQTPLPPMSMGEMQAAPGQYDQYGQYAMNPNSGLVNLGFLSAPAQRQYQALTPEMYSNFYATPLSANAAAYGGLVAPDYNDPNSKYLPPPPPPPTVMSMLAPLVFSGGGGDFGGFGGYGDTSGSDSGNSGSGMGAPGAGTAAGDAAGNSEGSGGAADGSGSAGW